MINIFTRLTLLIAFIAIPLQAVAELENNAISNAYKSSYQYEKTENYKDAVKAIMLIYNQYPNTYTVNLRLGYLYLKQGLFANASNHYQKAEKALPSSISPKLGEMSVAIAQMQYSKAEKIGFNILKIDNHNYYGNLKLAFALTQNKKYENAKTVVEKMLVLYPENVPFISQYAAIYSAQNKFKKAAEYYSNVLILDPENIAANYYFSVEKKGG